MFKGCRARCVAGVGYRADHSMLGSRAWLKACTESNKEEEEDGADPGGKNGLECAHGRCEGRGDSAESRVQDLRFRIWGLRLRVQLVGFRA